MAEIKRLITPLTDSAVLGLKIGEQVLISGILYTARDAAHKRLTELIAADQKLPFDPRGQIIYYVGPAPARPGMPLGPAGPTTSYRMDPYTPALLEKGIKAMIGKGTRSAEVVKALQRHKSVYLAAIGGAAALILKSIRKAEVIAYEDLGTEAIRRLEVEDFQTIVVNDCFGNDLYQEGRKKYQR